jgi:predicted TIM-barrel fold metal-dependent hydrolase
VRRLITSDCHIAAPYSVLEELPESYREHFPRVEHRSDGDYLLAPAGGGMMGMSPMGRPPATKIEGDSAVREAVGACDEAHASFDPAEVLADLQRDGVFGAVLIGRIAVGYASMPIEADIAYSKVVNDWTAEHWGPYTERVAPGIVLPYRDVAACVLELERCAVRGMRPALLPDAIGDKPYHLAEWEPFWEAAAALKVPITMHVGGTRLPSAALGASKPYAGLGFVGWYNQCVGMGETLGWLTFTGVFERHPDLHVIMTEGYAGWLAFAMQFFDHHWNDSRFGVMQTAMGPWAAKLEAPPSFYLKRQAHATFMWDPMAIENRHLTGTDCLLWGNDYPHREGSFPFSKEWIDKQFAGVPADEVDAMLCGNAAKLFGIAIDDV